MVDLRQEVGVLAEGSSARDCSRRTVPSLSVFAATTRGRFKSWANQTSPNAPAPRYL